MRSVLRGPWLVRRAAADNEAIQLVEHLREESHAHCACPPQVRAWLVTQRATAGEGWCADEGVRAHDEREEEAAKMLRWSPRCHGAIRDSDGVVKFPHVYGQRAMSSLLGVW